MFVKLMRARLKAFFCGSVSFQVSEEILAEQKYVGLENFITFFSNYSKIRDTVVKVGL